MWSRSRKWCKALQVLPALIGLLALRVEALADTLSAVAEKTAAHQLPINVSAAEVNRLAIEGRRVATVVPAQPGIVAVKKDEAAGAVYFSLIDQKPGAAVTFFVTDEQGDSYRLLFVARAMSGEEVILKPKSSGSTAVSSIRAGQEEQGTGRALSYQRAIKDLIIAMAAPGAAARQPKKESINRTIPLWTESKLVLLASYVDGENVGEHYSLLNTSNTEMVLDEQELFRGGVKAISIKRQILPPGQSTDLFVVRARHPNE